jgi:hypothetical protein
MRSVGDRPCAQRFLHLRVQPLLRRDPPFHDPEVNPAKRGRPLQGRQLGQRNPRVVTIHRQQQHAAGTSVQRMGLLQESRPSMPGSRRSAAISATSSPSLASPSNAASPVVGESAVTTRKSGSKRRTSAASVAILACRSASTTTKTGFGDPTVRANSNWSVTQPRPFGVGPES